MKKRKVRDISEVVKIESKYFGVDLHKDQITWHCIRRTSEGGLIRENGRVSTKRLREEFIPMLGTDNCYVIVEASCSTFYFTSLIETHCTKVLVVNPSAFREIFMTGRKTDKIDAKKLADRLRYHIEMSDKEDGFPEVYVPDEDILKLRKLITTYELLVKQMTQLKNQMKSVIRAKLVEYKGNIFDDLVKRVMNNKRLDETDCLMIKTLKQLYDNLAKEKEEIKKTILSIGTIRFQEELALLITITGISAFGAIIFMADICTVERFKSAKKMTSYLASTGKVDSSGNTTRNKGLNKRGRRTTYRFILQGLVHIINGNEVISQFKERHALKKPNKVRAAIVRKTFVIMYYMLKNKEVYRYLNESVYKRKLGDLKRFGFEVKKVARLIFS